MFESRFCGGLQVHDDNIFKCNCCDSGENHCFMKLVDERQGFSQMREGTFSGMFLTVAYSDACFIFCF